MTTQPDPPQSSSPVDSPNSASSNGAIDPISVQEKPSTQVKPNPGQMYISVLPLAKHTNTNQHNFAERPVIPIILTAIAILILGLTINNFWIGMSGAIVSLLTVSFALAVNCRDNPTLIDPHLSNLHTGIE